MGGGASREGSARDHSLPIALSISANLTLHLRQEGTRVGQFQWVYQDYNFAEYESKYTASTHFACNIFTLGSSAGGCQRSCSGSDEGE